MSRDPAFLFYDGDAARDVSHMNRLERGAYFDFIQAQRKFGGVTVEQVRKIIGKDFDACWPSLEMVLTVVDGVYFIQWVKDSTEKRAKFAQIQKERIQTYWDKKHTPVIPRNNHGKSTDLPYANEIENEIENEDVTETYPVKEVIEYLNLKAGKNYSTKTEANKKPIRARFAEGKTLDDFKGVIDKKTKEWTGTDWEKFLRPETLFGNKFEGYLNQPAVSSTGKTGDPEMKAMQDKINARMAANAQG